MFQDFKAFILRGNVLELAVAVIIAGAFGSIVTSFTNDIILPPIGLATGGVDFTNLELVLQDGIEPTLAADGETVVEEGREEVAIRYGKFIQTIIDFLIIAFILFLVLRAYKNMQAPDPVKEVKEELSKEVQILQDIRDLLRDRPGRV